MKKCRILILLLAVLLLLGCSWVKNLMGALASPGPADPAKALLGKDRTRSLVFLDPAQAQGFDNSANYLRLLKILKDDYHVDVERIVDVGPVIGSHTGPGVVALFFIGRER